MADVKKKAAKKFFSSSKDKTLKKEKDATSQRRKGSDGKGVSPERRGSSIEYGSKPNASSGSTKVIGSSISSFSSSSSGDKGGGSVVTAKTSHKDKDKTAKSAGSGTHKPIMENSANYYNCSRYSATKFDSILGQTHFPQSSIPKY